MKDMKFLWLFDPTANVESFLQLSKRIDMNWVVANPFIVKLDGFKEKVKENGFSFGLNFPVFMEESYLKKNPDAYAVTSFGNLAKFDWLHFACTSNKNFFSNQKKELKRLLSEFQPELVCLDFIRNFTFWEKVKKGSSLLDIEDGCYCENCLSLLSEECGVDLRSKSAAEIKTHYLRQLSEFRIKRVVDAVIELCIIIKEWNSSVPIMLKLVPWTNSDKEGARLDLLGQDLDMLKDHIDIFGIMSFMHTIGETPEKLEELVQEVKNTTGKKVIATLQVDKIYDEPPFTDEQRLSYINTLKKLDIAGYNIFDFNGLSAKDSSIEKLYKI